MAPAAPARRFWRRRRRASSGSTIYYVQPTALVSAGRSAPARRTSGRHFSGHINFGLFCSSSTRWIPSAPSASNWARHDDVGGGARAYNAIVTELMQCVDQYRSEPGFILMAATNFYEGLDEALVRDIRFDEKIRVDLPDEAAREQILTAQLAKRFWTPFPVEAFCQCGRRDGAPRNSPAW